MLFTEQVAAWIAAANPALRRGVVANPALRRGVVANPALRRGVVAIVQAIDLAG
jgi:hypothetical protein